MHDGALDFPMSEVGSDEAGKSALVDKGSTAALDSTVSRKRGDEPVAVQCRPFCVSRTSLIEQARPGKER